MFTSSARQTFQIPVFVASNFYLPTERLPHVAKTNSRSSVHTGAPIATLTTAFEDIDLCLQMQFISTPITRLSRLSYMI